MLPGFAPSKLVNHDKYKLCRRRYQCSYAFLSSRRSSLGLRSVDTPSLIILHSFFQILPLHTLFLIPIFSLHFSKARFHKMRLVHAVLAVGALLTGSTNSQQYAGEVIDTGLPNVPGSEIAFFKIPGVMDSNKRKAANLTLINYYSHGSNGKRLVESKIQRAVIIVHGLNRDPQTYESNMLSALAQVTSDPNINKDSVAVMAPYFPNGICKPSSRPSPMQ